MPHPRFTREELAQRGQDWYENTIRRQVETPENLGKIISIDIETGVFAIAEDVLSATKQLLQDRPDAALWTERIGHEAVYELISIKQRVVHIRTPRLANPEQAAFFKMEVEWDDTPSR
jgi:hypothetical protein